MPAYDAILFSPPAPIATISIRNQQKNTTLSNITMLIDSGADVTLIPRESVLQLDLLVDPDHVYELMGFDGSTSIAQVIELDLIFLSRVFRGRFLISDQEVGILGRDILNHLSILFDGPGLSWNEEKPLKR